MSTQLTPLGSGRTGTVPRPPDCRVCSHCRLISTSVSDPAAGRAGGHGPTSRGGKQGTRAVCTELYMGSRNWVRNADQAPGSPNHLGTASCLWPSHHLQGFPGGSGSKESVCNEGDPGSIPGLGRSPGEGNGYPPGESQGQRSLAGYSTWGHKESDTTEQLSHHL